MTLIVASPPLGVYSKADVISVVGYNERTADCASPFIAMFAEAVSL